MTGESLTVVHVKALDIATEVIFGILHQFRYNSIN